MRNHRDRYHQIAETLSRHGLGYLVGVLGLERYVPFHRGLLGHEPREEPYTRPEHVRLALEQLGATFVKLGQILSTRSDLLGPEYQVELAKLQDAAPPVPSDAIRELITRELGGCVLQEHWKGAGGLSGTSFNLYDAERRMWHQTWVDGSGALLQLDGGLREGRMVLEGRRPVAADSAGTVLHRITWTPLASDSVRQLWETSADEGKTWAVAFDGLYRRKKAR